jgi:hypothetical protein
MVKSRTGIPLAFDPLMSLPALTLTRPLRNDHRCAGRAEFSKRQDRCLEPSWKFHSLIQPTNLYCIETLVLDANILRDSILTRIEQIRLANLSPATYLERLNRIQVPGVCPHMRLWMVCFQELKALTNTKQLSVSGLNVNPMELNDIYEHVWNLGSYYKQMHVCQSCNLDSGHGPRSALPQPDPTYIAPPNLLHACRCAWQRNPVWSFTRCWNETGRTT